MSPEQVGKARGRLRSHVLTRGRETVRRGIDRIFRGRNTDDSPQREMLLLARRPIDDLSYLESPELASDAHQAVSRWWAQAMLNPQFDSVGTEAEYAIAISSAAQSADAAWILRSAKIPDFSYVLELLSRAEGRRRIATDYDPEPVDGKILIQAAKAAGLQTGRLSDFPWHSCTQIDEAGIVWAGMGETESMKQIWPAVSVNRR